MYIAFVIILIVMCTINLFIARGDFLFPSCVLSEIMLLCAILALYNYDTWELNNFGGETVFLLTSELVFFSAIGIFVDKIVYGKKTKKKISAYNKNYVINADRRLFRLSIVFQIIVIVICIYYILKIGKTYGASDWTHCLNLYKELEADGTVSLPTLLQECNRLVAVLGYIYLFIFTNNIVISGKIRRNIKYIIPAILFIIRSFVLGNRYNMLSILAAFVFCYFILYRRKYGWKRVFKFKYIIYFLIGVFVILAIFVSLRSLVGRTDSIDPIYYCTMYTSGWIKLFDLYIKIPVVSSSIWGKETFSGLNIFLANRGFGVIYDINLEFRFLNGTNLGNVYGALRRYYQDFGYWGAMCLVSICSCIYNIMYAKLTYSKKNTDFLMIIFMYMVNALCILPIDDKFYTIFFTPSFVIYFVEFYILYLIIVRKKSKARLR